MLWGGIYRSKQWEFALSLRPCYGTWVYLPQLCFKFSLLFFPMERWGAPVYSYKRNKASQALGGLCFENKNGVKKCTVLSDRMGCCGSAAPRLPGKSTGVTAWHRGPLGFAEPAAAAAAMSASWNHRQGLLVLATCPRAPATSSGTGAF